MNLKEALDYNPITGNFTWKIKPRLGPQVQPGMLAGWIGVNRYRYISFRNKDYLAHRLAWFFTHGRWPQRHIDHINGDPSDNRISNLRECTPEQNQRNRKVATNSKTGIPGVTFWAKRNRWIAKIKHQQKSIHLGCFKTKEEALLARRAAEVLYFKEFARVDKSPAMG